MSYQTYDIHDNLVGIGDFIYAVTTPSPGSQSKRLFHAEVLDVTKQGKLTIKCTENDREVKIFGTSCIKPYPRGMYTQ